MQIAVHYDKVHPARRVDVAEAAARAVVALLRGDPAPPAEAAGAEGRESGQPVGPAGNRPGTGPHHQGRNPHE